MTYLTFCLGFDTPFKHNLEFYRLNFEAVIVLVITHSGTLKSLNSLPKHLIAGENITAYHQSVERKKSLALVDKERGNARQLIFIKTQNPEVKERGDGQRAARTRLLFATRGFGLHKVCLLSLSLSLSCPRPLARPSPSAAPRQKTLPPSVFLPRRDVYTLRGLKPSPPSHALRVPGGRRRLASAYIRVRAARKLLLFGV